MPHFAAPSSLFDFLVYWMHVPYSVMAVHVTRIYEGVHGITRQDWYLLASLAALGELSPSELAEKSDLDRSHASRALKSLREKGLVERKQLPNDRRHATVHLTAQGKALYERVFKDVAAYNAALVKDLSEDDQRALGRFLKQIHSTAVALNQPQTRLGAIDRRRGGSRRQWEQATRTRGIE